MGLSSRKLALAAVVAFAWLANAAPSNAAPMSVRGLAAQQVRLSTLAYHMAVGSAGACTDPQMFTGLVLHDLSQYDRVVRPAVSRAFSLSTGVGVLQIVPGSIAARSGLQIDDEIVAIGGRSVLDPSAVSQQRKSYARMQRLLANLQTALRNGPAEILVQRSGRLIRLTLLGELGCGGDLAITNSSEMNAWSDGKQVMVTTAMISLARNNEELAFVIAHEMAHNILGHSRSSSASIFGLGLGRARQREVAADQLAVRLMSNGGYNGVGGITFLEGARRRFWWNVSIDHPGFGTRIKAVRAAMMQLPATALTSRQIAAPQAAPLVKRTESLEYDAPVTRNSETRIQFASWAALASAAWRTTAGNCQR